MKHAIYLAIFAFLNFNIASASDIEMILQAKRGVVSLKNNVRESAYNEKYEKLGTAFLIDKQQGVLLTNQHLADQGSINDMEITFFNGRKLDAKFVYSDPLLDFSFIKVNPQDIPETIIELQLTKEDTKSGDNVFIIGNNQAEEFSVQTGMVTNEHQSIGYFPNQTLRISLNTRGGSSGSPVFNKAGKVIALNFGGDDTFALAIPSHYILDAYKSIKKRNIPPRKSTGALFGYYSLDDAVKFHNFPKNKVDEYIHKYPASSNKILYVKRILHGSPSEGILEPGDILLKANNLEIGPHLYRLQKLLNESKKNAVGFEIYRDGKFKIISVPLYDLNQHEVRRMVSFGGAIFYESDNFMSFVTGMPFKTVLFSNIDPDSSFNRLPYFHMGRNGADIRIIKVTELGNVPIKSLDDLIKIIPQLVKQQNFTIKYKNYGMQVLRYNNTPVLDRGLRQADIKYNQYLKDPTIYNFNPSTSGWVSETVIK